MRRNWLAVARLQEVRSAARCRRQALMWFSAWPRRQYRFLVDPARGAAGQVGGHEAGVGALRAGLDAGDDPLDPAPAAGAVPELLVAAQFVGSGHGSTPGGGALLESLDMAAQRRGGGDPEDEVQARGAAEVEHLGG